MKQRAFFTEKNLFAVLYNENSQKLKMFLNELKHVKNKNHKEIIMFFVKLLFCPQIFRTVLEGGGTKL